MSDVKAPDPDFRACIQKVPGYALCGKKITSAFFLGLAGAQQAIDRNLIYPPCEVCLTVARNEVREQIEALMTRLPEGYVCPRGMVPLRTPQGDLVGYVRPQVQEWLAKIVAEHSTPSPETPSP